MPTVQCTLENRNIKVRLARSMRIPFGFRVSNKDYADLR